MNDWVYLSEKSKYPMRVTAIDKYNCLLDFEGNEGDPFDGIYGEGGIAPIPLTGKMLLLNGWSRDDVDDDFYELNAYNHKAGVSRMDIFWRHDNEISPCMFINDGHIPSVRFVHEMQHALRLCGLDDLADNFKIE